MKNKLLPYLPYPEIPAKSGEAKQLIVFLHGLGSDGDDLISLAPFLRDHLPDCHFISPHGIEAYDMAPYGRQWFSLSVREKEIIRQLMSENAPAALQIIEDKQKELGLTNKETIIVGFSQGAMLGLYINLTTNEPYLAAIGFSGMLIEPDIAINKTTPICLIHGDIDNVVDVSALQNAADYLHDQNVTFETHRINGLAHSIDNHGLNFVINFIKKLL